MAKSHKKHYYALSIMWIGVGTVLSLAFFVLAMGGAELSSSVKTQATGNIGACYTVGTHVGTLCSQISSLDCYEETDTEPDGSTNFQERMLRVVDIWPFDPFYSPFFDGEEGNLRQQCFWRPDLSCPADDAPGIDSLYVKVGYSANSMNDARVDCANQMIEETYDRFNRSFPCRDDERRQIVIDTATCSDDLGDVEEWVPDVGIGDEGYYSVCGKLIRCVPADTPPVPGDFDGDGDVDSADRTTLTRNWTGALRPGTGNNTFSQGDADRDGDVDSSDLNLLTQNWTGSQD